VSIVMPTTAWTGTFEPCARRVLELLDRSATPCDFVVAFDGPTGERPAWLERPDVVVVATGRRTGPAAARNLAAERARGRILFFVDADVTLAPDALEHVLATFEADPDRAGVFGMYDDEPAAPGLVSRFRNLLHHHTHLTHPGTAGTFWAGCGAIRAPMFLDVGGFDAGFGCPSVEDIELGMRVTAAGGRIELDPGLRCKHLKRWTLASMILTDVFSRAVPWTRLLAANGDMPATLNIDWRSRVSGACAVTLVASLVVAPWLPAALAFAAACFAVVLVLNAGFYRLCLRKGGLAFAGGAAALHLLYFVYASLTFGVVAAWNWMFGPARSTACRPRPTLPTESMITAPASVLSAE
jgi:cellulose synthase/poly-beta-1,6-N-acetylglucosamine synthase-like glycosyltransferase